MRFHTQKIYFVYHCHLTIKDQSINMKELVDILKTKDITWFQSCNLECEFYPKLEEPNILSNSKVEFCICLKYINSFFNDTKWHIAIMETGEMFVFLLLDKSGLENEHTMSILSIILSAFVESLEFTYKTKLTFGIDNELEYFLIGNSTGVFKRLRDCVFKKIDDYGFQYIECKNLRASLKLYWYDNTFTAWTKGPFLSDHIERVLNDYFVLE